MRGAALLAFYQQEYRRGTLARRHIPVHIATLERLLNMVEAEAGRDADMADLREHIAAAAEAADPRTPVI